MIDARPTPRKPSGDLIADYIAHYAARINRHIQDNACALLVGPLGCGKSAVLERVKSRVESKGAAQCAYIDVAAGQAAMRPRDLLFALVNALEPGAFTDEQKAAASSEGDMRAWLRDWMRANRRGVVLLLDHIERLSRARDIFTLLRALYQQFQADADQDAEDGAAGPAFVFVLASAQSLRRQLLSPVSPISNILREEAMLDCDTGVRRAYWSGMLRGLSDADRDALLGELDTLCGGDPYVMRHVGRMVRTALEKLTQLATSADARATVEGVITRLRTNPVSVAPLFERYGEMLEDDFDALNLAMALLHGRPVTPSEAPARDEGLTAPLWSGLFVQRDGAWHFRSGLARAYFDHSFAQSPARVVNCYRRNQQYESAIRYLDNMRDSEPNWPGVLEDVTLAWVRDANTPSQAWQAVAGMLDLWFGTGAQLYRYHAPGQSAARLPDAYYRVVPGGLETLAEVDVQQSLRGTHREEAGGFAAARSDFTRGIVATAEEGAAPGTATGAPGAARWCFPLTHDGREYGAVMWSEQIYRTVGETSRLLEFWTNCFNTLFREIARFERDVISGVDIARIQRIAQENSTLERIDGVLRIILTALTARAGLQFDRAALLTARGNDRLIGRVAIGGHTPQPDGTAMRAPQTLAEILQASAEALSALEPAQRTPLDNTVRDVDIRRWRDDPILSTALYGEAPSQVPYARVFAEGASPELARLLHTEPAANRMPGAANPVLIVPIRDATANRLIGALLVDKPFDGGRIKQEQLDLLPQFAAQIALVLQNESAQLRRELFDRFSEFSTQRWSLQETLDKIAEETLPHLRGLVSQLMVTIWETSKGSDTNRPNRRQSTLRVARSYQHGNLLKDWHYSFYGEHEPPAGCVDRALVEPNRALYIADLPAWRHMNGPSTPQHLFERVRSVYSCELLSDEASMPRGVISFQSYDLDAFGPADHWIFRQIAQRVTNVVEKALSYEGLSRARRNTRQLNKAMSELMQQRTVSDLHLCILERARDLFPGDMRRLDSNRRADSAALLAMDGVEIAGKLSSTRTTMAEQLAASCGAMRAAAMRGEQVFVEYASRELVARDEFGEDECALHASVGAESSVWTRVGAAGDMLLVLAWKTPRRMNNTERTALPLFSEIAARTNGVIEQEREMMRAQLESSLRVEDYAAIEHEYTHQWNKRVRTMRQNARFALEALDEAAARARRRRDAGRRHTGRTAPAAGENRADRHRGPGAHGRGRVSARLTAHSTQELAQILRRALEPAQRRRQPRRLHVGEQPGERPVADHAAGHSDLDLERAAAERARR